MSFVLKKTTECFYLIYNDLCFILKNNGKISRKMLDNSISVCKFAQ